MNDELSPLSSGIDSITPFPQLEDDASLDTTTTNDDDESLHMKTTPRRNRAGTNHSVIRASPSAVSKSEMQSPTELSDDGRNLNAEQILSPSIEIQEDSEDAEFQSQYYVENESLEGTEDISLDSTGEEFNDDDDELQELSSDEDGDDDSHERGSNGVNMHRPFMQSTSSLTGPNAFAPPFYNRPPTPLPPSPSLTSLLRPPFSTTTSRPTTPDTSDAETPNDTEAAVAKSARIATTVPRASPKVPTYEYYGFVLYLTSSFAFCMSEHFQGMLWITVNNV